MVPVAAADTVGQLEKEADRVIAISTPTMFWAVGAHYDEFGEVTDDEVLRLMSKERERVSKDNTEKS